MSQHVKTLQTSLGLTADGLRGPKTDGALWSAVTEGRVSVQPRVSAPVTSPNAAWPSQAGVAAFYGPAGGPDCTAGRVELPFAFPLAWDDSQRVTRVSCHIKVASAFTAIWNEAAAHYGEAKFRNLRLDQFGGCFNVRQMRGGSAMSMHSWGIAWDVDPINNQLRWGRDRAQMARLEYEPFWKIVESQGAVSLGRTQNRDFMHMQFATF